jgi:glutathione S-transferase
LALAYAGLPWQICDIHVFSKKELLAYPLPPHMNKRTVPAIFDATRGEFVMDSTPVLRYLCTHYPQLQVLYPGDVGNQQAIDAMLIEFDTKLGLLARRFGYTQIILECPSLLSTLFLGRAAGGFFTLTGVRWVSGHILGMLLCQRFAFHQSESSHLYEALENYLLTLARRLEARAFVVGDAFSIADLALAAYLRPLTIVPFFHEHPQLQSLFARQRAVLAEHSQESSSAYQAAIAKARQSRLPVRRRIRQSEAALPFPDLGSHAHNDQRPVWTWQTWLLPYRYLFPMRSGKVRQAAASQGVR